ncbi:fimbrial protein [Salmonella enterica]|uniref:fimbrial protein n=1 Tax=Salmonella enterica TaxID=28901 RepID=UPI001590C303|nr:fimbrial protein [Salmonella enterica]QVB77144.1 fimbrial protein [Salmonella enterica subsp. enterica serovar Rubislaw]
MMAFLLLLTCFVQAADNMSFHGTLVEPPCTINGGQTIEVDFGTDLGVNKINGINYLKQINYFINCDSGYVPNQLALVIDTSSMASYDNAAVQTDKMGLGIRILLAGSAVSFGAVIPLSDPHSPPVMQGVPVQDPGVTLSAGAFEATMSLRVDYM